MMRTTLSLGYFDPEANSAPEQYPSPAPDHSEPTLAVNPKNDSMVPPTVTEHSAARPGFQAVAQESKPTQVLSPAVAVKLHPPAPVVIDESAASNSPSKVLASVPQQHSGHRVPWRIGPIFLGIGGGVVITSAILRDINIGNLGKHLGTLANVTLQSKLYETEARTLETTLVQLKAHADPDDKAMQANIKNLEKQKKEAEAKSAGYELDANRYQGKIDHDKDGIMLSEVFLAVGAGMTVAGGVISLVHALKLLTHRPKPELKTTVRLTPNIGKSIVGATLTLRF